MSERRRDPLWKKFAQIYRKIADKTATTRDIFDEERSPNFNAHHLCNAPAQPKDVVIIMWTGVLDRRKSERHATRTTAEIMIPQLAPLGCIASNVSDGGAKIHIRSADVPDVFVLRFTETGRKRHCRVVWRQGAEVGVAFTDKAQVNFGRRIASP